MSEEAALTRRENNLPDSQSWAAIERMAEAAAKSGLFPALETPQKAAMILLAARDLGISPTTAMRGIYIVKGKIGMSADLMQALVRRDIPGAVFKIAERSETRATVEVGRPGQESAKFSFSMDDARKAGLLDSPGVWRHYPKPMLWARAIADACRAYFPEAASGLYVEGELPGSPEPPSPKAASIVEVTSAPEQAQEPEPTPELPAHVPQDKPEEFLGDPSKPTAEEKQETGQRVLSENIVRISQARTIEELFALRSPLEEVKGLLSQEQLKRLRQVWASRADKLSPKWRQELAAQHKESPD